MDSLKGIIKEAFGLEFPISGGNGSSIEDAIIIEVTDSSGISMEYKILDCIHKLGGVSFKFVKQEQFLKNEKHYDKIKLEVSNDLANYYNYYFDITNFFGRYKYK